jgi:hypothetical protein
MGNWVVLFSDDVIIVLEPGAAELPGALSDALAGIRGLHTLAAVSRKLLTWDTRLRCDLVAVLDPAEGIQIVVRGGLMVRDAETGAVVVDGRVGVGWQHPNHLAEQLHVEFEAREGSVSASELPLGTTKVGALRIDLRPGVTYTPSSFPPSFALAPGSVPNPTRVPAIAPGLVSQYQERLVQSRGSLDERLNSVFAQASAALPPLPPETQMPPRPYPSSAQGGYQPVQGGYPSAVGGYQSTPSQGPAYPPAEARPGITGPIFTAPIPGYQQAMTLPAPIPDWLRDRTPPPSPYGGQEFSRPIQEYSQPIQFGSREYSQPIHVPSQEYSQPIQFARPEYSQPMQFASQDYSRPIGSSPAMGSFPSGNAGASGSITTQVHFGGMDGETSFLPVTKQDAVKPPASGPVPTVGSGAVLSFSDGRVVPIDGKLIIGRSPKSDDPYVKTFKVASPNHDVSRSHMSIEPKGDGWLVTDMASTNGTLVRRPSAATVIAAEGSPVQVGLGTLISLGDGVVLRVDPA